MYYSIFSHSSLNALPALRYSGSLGLIHIQMDADFSDDNSLQEMLDDLRSFMEQLTNSPAGQLSLGYVF
jgi:hypothetical protein